ncbi:MAG TPA: hypothetical protein ENI72_02955 [Rhodospirillales bacterium]|nr:hypothetical protein [Rhodospirillales bacterium]
MNTNYAISPLSGLFKALAGFALLSIMFSVPALAGRQSEIGPYDINVSHGLTFTGNPKDAPAPLALRGYDTVSYFTNGKPQLGTIRQAATHNGAIYWFVSKEHKKMFEANPGRYLPQYGGFCAYGVTQRTKFDGDPLLWNIHKGKLYLNVTPGLQAKWLGKGLLGNNLEENITAANRIWPGIRGARPQPLFEAWLAKKK